jgi:hypothetical protein
VAFVASSRWSGDLALRMMGALGAFEPKRREGEGENGNPARRMEGGVGQARAEGVQTGKNMGLGEDANRWGPVTVLVV